MTQPNLDFSLPINGTSPRSRHHSRSGAEYAAPDRPSLTCDYLQLLRVCGPLSDQSAARMLGRETCSLNSTRGALVQAGVVEDSGEDEIHVFANGKTTTRTKWRLK